MAKKSKEKNTKGGQIKPSKGEKKTIKRISTYNSLVGISAVIVAFVAIIVLYLKPNKAVTNIEPSINDIENSTENQKLTNPELAHDAQETNPSHVPVSIAAFHNLQNPKRSDLIHYLQYDDAYSACLLKDDLKDDTFGVWELKKSKLQFLEQIANIPDRWIIQTPLMGEAPNSDLLASTCRVMTLSHDDFDAVAKLRAALQEGTGDKLILEKNGNALEYRTMACLSRLVEMSQGKSPSPEVQVVRTVWYHAAQAAKEAADAEPPAPLKVGWTEFRKLESFQHSYYQRVGAKGSTWIRPTAKPDEEGVPPTEFEYRISLLVRGIPCPLENSYPLLIDDQ